MKKVLLCVLLVLLSFTGIKVCATCFDDTLNTWIEKVKIKQVIISDDYKAPSGVSNEDLSNYSYLLMLDIPRSDLKVMAKDTYSSSEYEVEYDSNYKNYVIGSEVHFINKVYTITIYMADDATSCAGEKMRTFTYTVPKYNQYHDTSYCEGNPDDENCGMYTEVKDTDKIDTIIKDDYDDMIKKEEYSTLSFIEKAIFVIKEYYLYVLIPVIAISIVYYVIIMITKKRREKK